MVTIKDIAKYTSLSPSTVSIVLRGMGEKRKISEATIEKVMSAAQKMGYTPNMQSKLLRSNLKGYPVITLLWDSSIRQYNLLRFLDGLHNSILKNDYHFELQIKPYSINHLDEAITERTLLGTNGLIICNASESDIAFLENNDFNIPIVLYNRYSAKYPTITMNDKDIGRIPAEVFIRHGNKRPAILTSETNFKGMNIRENTFCSVLNEHGINDISKVIVSDTLAGGYEGGTRLAGLSSLPDCLFCTSDTLAIGALKAFHEKNISIPDHIEIISIGSGPRDLEEYSIPSLSVVSLPMEAMADACLARISSAIATFNYSPDTKEFSSEYLVRESCPY
ncbi:LacI family DNA-binding transcriptional regulator [Butyrivibrio sp. LC3010]|uniref:LacI family DNA-binding transcriptional regulator n=1 Tax=Butyrivibrio sp. LC3010 TaxID=1280680 RepID=UPI000425E4F6|nr:LacI family DNA-binding transcriptional regulator [Butyrivibrio sp. LC3010]